SNLYLFYECFFSTTTRYAEHIIGNIKHNIESNLMRNDTIPPLTATHEMAFSAGCDMPKNTNATQWNGNVTWNLYFPLTHNKHYNSVSSAVLRLYMNGVNSTARSRESNNCKNPSEQMIRITASVYYRKNRKDNTSQERKKSVCSCITITRSYRGWITMDMLLAVKTWDKPNRNLGIAIDVEDQDDRPLRAADFFRPADCSEASKHNVTRHILPYSSAASTTLPWSYLRSAFAGTSNEMDNVSHNPRIDIMIRKVMHHNHRTSRNKHHYHQQANRSGTGVTGNSYEHDDLAAKCPRFDGNGATAPVKHSHHTQHTPHQVHRLLHQVQTHSLQHRFVQHPVAINKAAMKKRRHLHHSGVSAGEGSDENRSMSSSASVLSGEDRNL
uniref:TGFb_propeptide domain-containing protein n=1 Tax=Anopheles epiroticus TaxID=199890 RepID=A0A182P5K2_9DIPT